eukprot:1580009-Rhodomonas_salina.1
MGSMNGVGVGQNNEFMVQEALLWREQKNCPIFSKMKKMEKRLRRAFFNGRSDVELERKYLELKVSSDQLKDLLNRMSLNEGEDPPFASRDSSQAEKSSGGLNGGQLELLKRKHAVLHVMKEKVVGVECFHCGKMDASMPICSKCKRRFFCNDGCMKAAWKSHKKECKQMSKESPLLQIGNGEKKWDTR